MDVRQVDKYLNLWMIKDEKKYLEEVMNCRTLKLFHRHVIVDGNVLLKHNLLKPLPGKAFTPEKGHGATTWRFGWGGFRRIRWIQVKDLYCGWLFGRSKKDDRASLDEPRFGWPMPCLLMASMTRKTPHVYYLGKSLPFLCASWMRLGVDFFLLGNFFICQTLPLVLLHGCHSYKKKDVLEFRQSKQLGCNVSNSCLQVVSSWASASSVGSSLSFQVARWRRVTKEWKALSMNECAYLTQSR